MKNSVNSRMQCGKISTTVLIAVFLAIGYVLTWVMFLGEGHPKLVMRGDPGNGVPIQAHVIAEDLIKDTMTMTLVPDVTSFSIAAARTLTSDVDVDIDTGVLVLAHKFKKGEIPAPWDAAIPIQEGDLKLSRSPAVIFLSVMAMLSLSLVVFSAANVALQVATLGRKLEFGMMVWVAAMHFVIPASPQRHARKPASRRHGRLRIVLLAACAHCHFPAGFGVEVVEGWKTMTAPAR